MRSSTSSLLLALFLTSPALAGGVFGDRAAAQDTTRKQQGLVAAVRGLPFSRDVRVEVEDADTMRARMEIELREQLSDEDLRAIGRTWQLLGLSPPGFDVATTYMHVLGESIGGYFDIEDQRLVLVARAASTRSMQGVAIEDMVIAHELVHALQDQHFDLWNLTRRDTGNSDVDVALASLVEGDASYAMLYRVVPDPDAIPLAALAPQMAAMGGASEDMGGEMGAAPAMLREPLIFPYTRGLAFAQVVKKHGQGWPGVDAAFAAPPLSTEQILHPSRYLRDKPDWPIGVDLRNPEGWLDGWTELDQDTFGELGLGIVLRAHLTGAARDRIDVATEGWGGDRYVVLERGDQALLAWLTTWDTPADAAEFEVSMVRALQAMRPDAAWSAASSDARGVEGDLRHALVRNKHDVAILLDVPSAYEPQLLRRVRKARRTVQSTLDQIAGPPEEPRPALPDL